MPRVCVLSNEIKSQHTLYHHASRACFCLLVESGGEKEALPDIWGGGGTLGLFWWGRAAGTPEPLAYTRASSSEFCYPIILD